MYRSLSGNPQPLTSDSILIHRPPALMLLRQQYTSMEDRDLRASSHLRSHQRHPEYLRYINMFFLLLANLSGNFRSDA